jgi:hypothetical protein
MGYFEQTSPQRPCYVRLVNNCPTVVVGGAVATVTKGRPSPPKAVCGLNLDYTPLGLGHVMGLHVGGPDRSENIVPQYQQWQQCGAWKKMENDTKSKTQKGDIFVALLEYANKGDAVARDLYSLPQFERMAFWDDYRIPTRFRIWLLRSTSLVAQNIETNILGAKLKDAQRDSAADKLDADLKSDPPLADFAVTQMPKEDYEYWASQQAAMAVEECFADYESSWKTQTTPSSPFRPTEVEYLMGDGSRGDEVRSYLKAEGWTANELNQYGSNHALLWASRHSISVGQAKIMEKRLEAYNELWAASKGGKAPSHSAVMKMKRQLSQKPY